MPITRTRCSGVASARRITPATSHSAALTSRCSARAGGADLLWRMRKSAALPVVQVLADGSYLSTIHAEPDRKSRRNPVSV
ncbi:hypothetical protein ACGFRB_29350 [Streptomyces sp. NPDC048718]|uniref:hypothetical protein n=1 Tax=Streptomyces sp. NPDC048718 TaxID=3365587 RepID=UPI00371F2385